HPCPRHRVFPRCDSEKRSRQSQGTPVAFGGHVRPVPYSGQLSKSFGGLARALITILVADIGKKNPTQCLDVERTSLAWPHPGLLQHPRKLCRHRPRLCRRVEGGSLLASL